MDDGREKGRYIYIEDTHRQRVVHVVWTLETLLQGLKERRKEGRTDGRTDGRTGRKEGEGRNGREAKEGSKD